MTSIQKVTAVPARYSYSTEQIVDVVHRQLKSEEQAFSLFEKMSKASGINTRTFALPLETILNLNGKKERAQIFADQGLEMALEVFGSLKLDQAPSTFISSSCSMPILPGLDCLVSDKLKLNPTITRIPFYQHGCVAGVSSLSLAAKLATDAPVVVLSVELCSLVHRLHDLRPEQILGTVLFADGAGGAVVTADDSGPLKILDSLSFKIPMTSSELGYLIEDDGAHLRISRDLPRLIEENLPNLFAKILAKNNLALSDLSWFLSHPGGVKILSAIEEALGLDKSKQRWSWGVLSKVGNLSSASIFHVLNDFLTEDTYRSGEKGIILGVGPGVTLEVILVQAQR